MKYKFVQQHHQCDRTRPQKQKIRLTEQHPFKIPPFPLNKTTHDSTPPNPGID